MIWQDLAITACSVVFVASLVPMLLRPGRPPLTSSVPTAAALTIIAAVDITLSLDLAAGITFCTAAGWWGLAGLRLLEEGHIGS